jgi:hypothetical protein
LQATLPVKQLSSFKETIMTARAPSMIILFITAFVSCTKHASNQQTIPIPNGDFEQWDNMATLTTWQTNSCPVCVPAYETYIVQKVTDAANGQFAAKFVYNDVYSSYASNKFAVTVHPTTLAAYVKSGIITGDTASIRIELFSGNNLVDNGTFYETSSNSNYRQITIAISQSTNIVDSALITITGGKKHNTELIVDNMVFLISN